MWGTAHAAYVRMIRDMRSLKVKFEVGVATLLKSISKIRVGVATLRIRNIVKYTH